ncbi:hypothetical protein, partial [Chromobacterium violaceum]
NLPEISTFRRYVFAGGGHLKNSLENSHLNHLIYLIFMDIIKFPPHRNLPKAILGKTLSLLPPVLHFSHICHSFYSHSNKACIAHAPIANKLA